MNKTKNIVTGTLLFALIAFLAYTVVLINQPEKRQLQGQIEARQIKVSSKLTGRIDSLPIEKGMDIKKGDLLFSVGSPEIKAKLQQAMAGRKAAKAQDNKAVNGARSEDIAAALNAYQKAMAAAELAEKTHQRIKNLYEDGVVPEQKLDNAKAKMNAAKSTAEAAKALYEKAKNGARSEDIEAASAMVDKADAVIEEIRSYLDETKIMAPVAGEVADIIAKEGELIPSGFPVVTLVDLDDIWCTIHLKETFMKSIEKGKTIKADIPALGLKDVPFRISYIHPLGDYATWKATKAKGEFDIKTFEIEARPVNPVKGLRPGMSVLIDQKEIENGTKVSTVK